MNSNSAPVPKKFRLSQLLSDTRYRGKTLQVIAAIAIVTLFSWLVSNTVNNFETLGKPLTFSFLWEKAGYDINQRLIEYSPDDSHFRAALVGLLNTLVVAFLGCLTATVIGLFVGIARLSETPGLARLARVYVEIFRNVPLLLWLLLIFALVTEALPPPDLFRGDTPLATMWFNDSIAITNRGVYVPLISFAKDGVLWAYLGAVFVAWFGTFGLHRFASARQRASGQRVHTIGPIIGLWVLVLSVVTLWANPIVEYPALRGFNFRGGFHLRNSLIALWMALSLYTAAYIAEIVRSGILAVSTGQREAAAALGFTAAQAMRLIVLPQALRVIIPPMISNYLNLTKNSSLAIAVGYMDVTGTLMGITMNQTGREVETVFLGMGVYLALSISISMILNWYNAQNKAMER